MKTKNRKLINMKNLIIITMALALCFSDIQAQTKPNEQLPVRGFMLSVPSPANMDLFLKFIEEELAPANVNLLILRVNNSYAYESYQRLRGEVFLSKPDAKKIVAVCKKHSITLVPKFNLLGHQSAGNNACNLLKGFPQFDETPNLKIEGVIKTGDDWYNPDLFYCKSYCPLHPDLHQVVFTLIDELTDVFESKWFHAGMDEVTIIGDAHCPRCSGRDPAELFASAVIPVYNHLAQQGKRMMIWGDRLLDGKKMGFHPSEASMNNTHRAIDMIPKEVFICDWHYWRAELTTVYFAMKGFDVVSCSAKAPDVASTYISDMLRFRKQASPEIGQHFQGHIETVWQNTDDFLKEYYDNRSVAYESYVSCVKRILSEFSTQK